MCSFRETYIDPFFLSTASRKRQMNTDKTHSDGNDADDESALPAKQPNRNRLSTVSFASAPFVAPSPLDPSVSETSKCSPLPGLSFVSKNSSFKSTDRTFTPGSTRTIRSSVGSASGASSTGDSVIDPDEEVTLTNDAEHLKGELCSSDLRYSTVFVRISAQPRSSAHLEQAPILKAEKVNKHPASNKCPPPPLPLKLK